jgi:membrane-associated phospholipid phosphatase
LLTDEGLGGASTLVRLPLVNSHRRLTLCAASLATAFAVCAAVIWLVMDLSSRAVRLDTRIYFELSTPNGSAVASTFAKLCNPTPFAYLAAVPIVIALARRRRWLALGAIIITVGAIVTSEVLKSKLGVSHPTASGYGTYVRHSWPSGAAAAATALACSLTLVAPPRLRPYAAVLGTAFALAVVCSVLRLGWHYPSDAVGGVLIALSWAAAALAGVCVYSPGSLTNG